MYLRWPRITAFVLTTALCITEIGLAAWTLADSHDKQELARKTLPGASLNLDDALAVGKATTAAAAVSAVVCLVMLFFTVFRPRQAETLTSIRLKEGGFALILVFFLGALIPATYYTATRSGIINAPGIPRTLIDQLVKASGQDLRYRKQKTILSYVIVGWIAFLFTAISLVLVSIAARKTLKHGVDSNGPLVAHETKHTTHQDSAAASTVAESRRPSVAHEKAGELQASV
ncbi:hypothetical protein JCM3775_005542 [Rhodotorula graminis]|uniref:MARVEL domain-containing protein n=1 Tax=Rhodotorula graminis (strain WP1) TaxID=578459 RepID=A0A194SA82_RHOGW|nr:uncharacterized protein RHOBADRAFT_41623 [Rhodotorula graminis WP1]KPV77628.1 hypothetical protein RHOBADRAFT_41623 [Rhodotorula graminis WP1]